MGQHRKTARRRKRVPKTTSTPPPVGESEFRLAPEQETGNVEYKLKLVCPSHARLQHLTTQMKWRLNEGNGEAIYQLGVADDGRCTGLGASELATTMESMNSMAKSANAALYILNDRCVHGEPGHPDSRRVLEVLVRRLPSSQQFSDMRIALLGSASSGKSTLCGVLTQGTLDNGAGKSRLNFLRYMHEIRTGKSSSVSIDCFGFSQNGEVLSYRNNDLKEIIENASKLVTLIDLAGDRKFLKTTIYGLSGYSPQYCALLINARLGWTPMTQEHMTIAKAFNIPIFVVITKVDISNAQRIQGIINQIQSVLERNQTGAEIKHVLSMEDSVWAAQSISANVLPIFTISNVTGENLDLMTNFLNRLPPRDITTPGADNTSNSLFYIDEIFNLPESGTILCGLQAKGSFNEAEPVKIGPDCAGNYRLGKIKSIRRNKQPVLKTHAGEFVSIAIEFLSSTANFDIRKGMVLIAKNDDAVCCRRFVARFSFISHSTEKVCVGFQGTAYIGSLRRTVSIVGFDAASIRVGEWSNVTFEFYGGPEFVPIGSPIFFRERNTKGMGEIVSIPES